MNVVVNPFPWQLSATQICTCNTKLENRWPTDIHEVQCYVRPRHRLVKVSPTINMEYTKTSPGNFAKWDNVLHQTPKAQPGQTEEIVNTASFYDAHQKSNINAYQGGRRHACRTKWDLP